MTHAPSPFDFTEFIVRLERRLAQPLPGLPVQLEMAPRPRSDASTTFDPLRAVPAAVVAMLFPESTTRPEPCLALTRRTDRVASHKGQICLPGGALDPDESPAAAALREAEEEIGVARDLPRIIGRLTPVLISVSGYRMEPFVAVAPRRPEFRVAIEEVDELIEIPLRALLDPRTRAERTAVREGTSIVIPFFSLEGREVWGATAMVLAELALVVVEAGFPS